MTTIMACVAAARSTFGDFAVEFSQSGGKKVCYCGYVLPAMTGAGTGRHAWVPAPHEAAAADEICFFSADCMTAQRLLRPIR